MIMMVLSCMLLMSAIAGCAIQTGTSGSATGESAQSSPAAGTTENAVTPGSSDKSSAPGTSKPNGENSKVLVVYYSATGNTETVANTIAETLGADTFELVPTDPYTGEDLNWSNRDSRVSKEHDNPDSCDVELTSTTVNNWDSYDTVFIGYPIWWGIAAWPVDGFIKANNFTGKTVISFCTSSSSGLGESGELLAKMAGTGNWKEGERFRSGSSNEDIRVWANSVIQ